MTLAYNPTIYNSNVHHGATGFALPLPILDWTQSESYTNTLVPIVGADGALCTFQRVAPIRFSIQGEIHGYPAGGLYTPAQSLTREDADAIIGDFRACLRGFFWLYRYGSKCWKECVCEGGLSLTPGRPDSSWIYRLEVLCLNPFETTDVDDGVHPGGEASPYSAALHGRA